MQAWGSDSLAVVGSEHPLAPFWFLAQALTSPLSAVPKSMTGWPNPPSVVLCASSTVCRQTLLPTLAFTTVVALQDPHPIDSRGVGGSPPPTAPSPRPLLCQIYRPIDWSSADGRMRPMRFQVAGPSHPKSSRNCPMSPMHRKRLNCPCCYLHVLGI
nr:uncharacterized protein LOC109757610 [Aegilops tauschii subsp. strangulata]